MSTLHRGPPIVTSYHVSVHLAKRFQRRRFFRNPPIRNKNCLWRPCLLTDRDQMSNLYRGPSINASYQVSVQLAKRFQQRRFLDIDQSETRIDCGSNVCQRIGTKLAIYIEDHTQMLSTKFRLIWQSGFREKDFQKWTNQKQELSVAAMFLNRSRPNEQLLQRTINRCFLPSFGSHGKAVSAGEIFRNRSIRNRN